MNRLILISLVLLLVLSGKSQSIENVDFKFIDEKIFIYYDLVNCTDGNKYEVEIKFCNDKGIIITPRNLIGDYGVIACGKNKKVVWELFQEIEKLEGKYKAIVTILNSFDVKGKIIEVYNTSQFCIIKSERINNQIIVELNRGANSKFKTGDILFVTRDKKNSNSSSVALNKIGKIKITETQNEKSKGILTFNEKLKYEQVQSHLPYSILNKYSNLKFNLFFKFGYMGINIESPNQVGVGLGINFYPKNNNVFLGIESGLIQNFGAQSNKPYFDLALKLGFTPYLLNSKHFFLGIEILPIPILFKFGNEPFYNEFKYGTSYGFFLGLQFQKTNFQMCVDRGLYTYSWGSGSENLPYLRLSLKLSYSIN